MNRTTTHRARAFALLVVSAALGAACSGDNAMGDQPLDESVESTSEALTIPEMQAKMNSLYDMNNVVTVKITMDATQWAELRAEQPAGGICNFNNPPDNTRFKTHTGVSVSISGSKFLTTAKTFTGVEIKKKSFCGSFTDGTANPPDKPSLNLKFTDAADAVLGTRHLTLNNSIQDASLIRQCLGYKLYGMAGLPRSRCNFADVFVNGTRVTSGVYVNVEPIKERYIDNPANGFTTKSDATLYEFERGDDFTAARIPFIDIEPLSKWGNKMDLGVAAGQIEANGLAAVKKAFDVNHFIKISAMEFLLKHWDGFNGNRNNTYVYNDSPSVFEPDINAGQIKFKLIPWGIDQILKPNSNFSANSKSVVGKLVVGDATLLAQLRSQVATYRESVFSRAKIDGELQTFIDLMLSKLSAMPGLSATEKLTIGAEAGVVKKQLKLTRSAAYIFGPSLPTTGLYLMDTDTMEAIHASNTETIPAGSGSTNFEVTHQTRADSAADRWKFTASTLATYKISSEATNRWLHSSNTMLTPAGHYYIYTTPNADPGSDDYNFWFEGDSLVMTGFFAISNYRSALYLRAGTDDLTPTGRQRVYQIAGADNASQFSWY